jgi:FkbM family methyltransferase
MTVKRRIKQLFENLTGAHLHRQLPRGVALCDDIKNYLPNFQVNLIFDVGAHTGQSTKVYLSKFPNAKIYCFEPVEETFHELQRNLCGHCNVVSFKLAFGIRKGTGQMVREGSSDMFFLLNTSSNRRIYDKSCLEQVTVDTVDAFSETYKISHINYMKVDTEGGDFDVLSGADYMLANHQIDLVEVEAGMNVGNTRHVPFEQIKRFLEEKGYALFGIYEQIHEWPTGEPHLRRTNPAFISQKLIRANVAAP